MNQTVLASWIAREWVRCASSWLLAAGVAMLGPTCLFLSPLGIVSQGCVFGSYIGSIWFLSTYVGVLVGLKLLSRAGSIWDEFGAGRQLWVGGLLVFLTAGLHGLLALCPLRALGPLDGLNSTSALLCAGHWAALAILVQRSPWSLAWKCIALTCLGWWIPALLDGSADWDRLRWLLSPVRHLEPQARSIETSLGRSVDTIPLVAWWVAAALLPTRSAFKR